MFYLYFVSGLALTVEGAKGSNVKVYHVHTPFPPPSSTAGDSRVQMESARPGEPVINLWKTLSCKGHVEKITFCLIMSGFYCILYWSVATVITLLLYNI